MYVCSFANHSTTFRFSSLEILAHRLTAVEDALEELGQFLNEFESAFHKAKIISNHLTDGEKTNPSFRRIFQPENYRQWLHPQEYTRLHLMLKGAPIPMAIHTKWSVTEPHQNERQEQTKRQT